MRRLLRGGRGAGQFVPDGLRVGVRAGLPHHSVPVPEVRVPWFALGRYPVLFNDYDRFVEAMAREPRTMRAGAAAAVR